ncbi:MAG: polysaccharide deacetylase family protein [Sedimenticola sp.]|nr:polysaccharide deacetylase family protein [Sedimenticola sp.]
MNGYLTSMMHWPFLKLITSSGSRAKLSILNYHRVHSELDPINPGEVDAEAFNWQMDLISRNFNILKLGEAALLLKQGKLPERSLCVTFDDGYADNVDVALPILQHYSVPTTFFIATGYLDGGMMWNDVVIECIRKIPSDYIDLSEKKLGKYNLNNWDERHAAYSEIVKKIKHLSQSKRQELVEWLSSFVIAAELPELMMTSNQVQLLHECGMEIGGHTVSHPILSCIPDEQAEREIADGKRRLEEIIQDSVKVFAYPNGKPGQDYLPKHVNMVERLGFDAAVSTKWGVSTVKTDKNQLRRFTPWDKSPNRFMLRLLRNYSHAD